MDQGKAGTVGLVRQALGFILLAALVVGCGRQSEPARSDSGEVLPDQEVTEFSLTETVGSEKSWTLFADRAEVFESKGFSRVFGVKVLFYDPEGEVSSVLTSNRGRISEDSKDLRALGDVVLKSAEGATLRTESLSWDNASGRIWSSEFVTVTRGNEVLTGFGFDSDPDLKNVQIHSEVKISVREKPGVNGPDTGKKPGEAALEAADSAKAL